MPIAIACGVCKTQYTLRDDLAGKKLRCKECQSVLVVPQEGSDPLEVVPDPGVTDYVFRRDRYLVNQKKLAFNRKYMVLDESNEPLMIAHRPVHYLKSTGAMAAWLLFTMFGMALSVGLAALIDVKEISAIVALGGWFVAIIGGFFILVTLMPRRHVTFYRDETMEEAVLTVTQDQKFSLLRAWYTVYDTDGKRIGRLMKHFLFNFFRKRWYIFDAEGGVRLMAQEDSMILSLLRRFLGTFFGLLRTNFIIVEPKSRRVIGEFNRKFSLFDKYVLDMSADRNHELDRRVAVALAVMLDAGEQR